MLSFGHAKSHYRTALNPTQLKLLEYLPITDMQIKEAVTVLKDSKQSDRKQFFNCFFFSNCYKMLIITAVTYLIAGGIVQ